MRMQSRNGVETVRKAAAFVGVSILIAALPSISQSNVPATRGELVHKIQEHADQDWDTKAGLKDELVISLFEGEAELTRGEIEGIYRERYFADLENSKHWWDHVPPWLYAVLVVLAFPLEATQEFSRGHSQEIL